MDEMARALADRVHFLFVYAREAHPDENPDHRAHRSIEQKFQHAHDLQERWKTPRTIVVDSLDGDVHRQYSGLPNMTYVISHTGKLLFKASWTLVRDLQPALEEAVAFSDKRVDRSPGNPYYKEGISYAGFMGPARRTASIGEALQKRPPVAARDAMPDEQWQELMGEKSEIPANG